MLAVSPDEVQTQLVHVFEGMDSKLRRISTEQVTDYIEEALGVVKSQLDELIRHLDYYSQHPEEMEKETSGELSREKMEQLLYIAKEAANEIQEGLNDVDRDEIQLLAHMSLSSARSILQLTSNALLPGVSITKYSGNATIEELPQESPYHYGLRRLLGTRMEELKEKPIVYQLVIFMLMGLWFPLSFVIGLGLLFEHIAPVQAERVWELIVNAFQMIRLWIFFARVTLKRTNRICWMCLGQFRETIATEGVVTATTQLAGSIYRTGLFLIAQFR